MGPLTKYLDPGEANYVMRVVHKGTCRNYFNADSIANKIVRAGYCPTMDNDTKEFVKNMTSANLWLPTPLVKGNDACHLYPLAFYEVGHGNRRDFLSIKSSFYWS